MERKYPSYIKEWRKKSGLTQQQVVDRLVELAGYPSPDDKALQIPTTTASLSRIENGEQNFNMATLGALAQVLGAEEPGHLLDRNPLMKGEVIHVDFDLDPDDRRRAVAMLTAMFGDRAG